MARVRVHVCTKEGQLRPSRRRPSAAGRGSGLPTRNRPHRGWKPTGAGQACAPHVSARDSNATRGCRASPYAPAYFQEPRPSGLVVNMRQVGSTLAQGTEVQEHPEKALRHLPSPPADMNDKLLEHGAPRR